MRCYFSCHAKLGWLARRLELPGVLSRYGSCSEAVAFHIYVINWILWFALKRNTSSCNSKNAHVLPRAAFALLGDHIWQKESLIWVFPQFLGWIPVSVLVVTPGRLWDCKVCLTAMRCNDELMEKEWLLWLLLCPSGFLFKSKIPGCWWSVSLFLSFFLSLSILRQKCLTTDLNRVESK